MNEFISLPAGLHKESPAYFQHVNLVFPFLEQTGTYCRHQFTSCITLHNKVEHPFIQISQARFSRRILTGLPL